MRFFLTLLVSFVSISVFAQHFTIDREMGFVNSDDPTKNYVIIIADGKNTSQIKNLLIGTLSKMFNHPDKVISTLGDNTVVVNGYNDNLIDNSENEILEIINYFTFNYNYTIEIRDGRIKVNAPVITNFTNHYKQGSFEKETVYDDSSKYKFLTGNGNDGKSNKFFNDFLDNIKKGINTDDDW